MDDTGSTMAVSSQSLLVVSGQAKGAVIPIPLGELVLGRDANRTGQLGGDPRLARRHARITSNGHGQVVLEDLGSTNGTLLNGARVTSRRPIHPSDIIEVGGSTLRVLHATSARGAAGNVKRPALADDEPLSLVRPVQVTDDALAPDALGIPSPGDAARGNPGETAAGGRRGDRSPPSAPRRGQATVKGQVRSVRQCGTEWTFRIVKYDRDGNRLPPIQVQMRGAESLNASVDAALGEGEEVRVIGAWKDGTLHTKHVENMTTGATVKTDFGSEWRSSSVFGRIILVFFVAVFVAVGLGVSEFVTHGFG
ncbi:MAG: FHA domain-containing protein [Pseudonocardiaceae bacterium]